MSFTKKTLTNAAWAFSSGYTNIAVAFVGNLVMARVLMPEDFGVFALASSLLVLLTMVTGFGSQEAIIQCHDETIEDLIPTAFWLSLVIGGTVAAAAVLLGLAVRSHYGSTVSWLIITMATLVPIKSLASAHSALLRRNMIYKPDALAQTVSVFSSFALGIVAALFKLGPWALLIRQGSAAIIYWLGMELSTQYRLPKVFNKRAARWIWDFGWKQMFSQISEAITGRYDNLVIGTCIGDMQLGYYSQAYRLALLGQQFTQGTLSPILLPMFAAVQSSADKLKYGFERVSYWICRVTPLLGVLVFLSGEKAVVYLYGKKWSTAGEYFAMLFPFLVLLPFSGVLRSFLVGSGRINDVVRTKWVQLVFFVFGVSIGAFSKNIVLVIWVVNLNQLLAVLLMGHAARRIAAIDWLYLCGAPTLAFAITMVLGQWILASLPETLMGTLLLVLFVSLLYSAILVAFDYRRLRQESSILVKASRGNR